MLSLYIDVHCTAGLWVELIRNTIIVGFSVALQCNRPLATRPMAVSSGHGKDGHLGYLDTSMNVFKRDSDSLDLRPEVKALALGLSETTGALLVGCGARTLAPLDTLEAAADPWLTASTSALASTIRPHEFTRTT